ncbi:ATP-binding protein [Trichocoleus sp. FACHB-262]|uniref:ATP-binding protein n=1 Tax=Trichocoleus sp. FACHB-262 TaxID=2692869 RepID=UPI0016865E2C|nr:ATP-binding protein [Trichocoleus sp. FACHB-262]MBD2122295.1 response regulator [Trichocoleus sp. FACHB-262]
MSTVLLTLEIRYEQDVVLTRQRVRQIAALIGFDAQDQTRIATAVSEMARNAFQYTGGGRVEFRLEGQSPQSFLIIIRDQGQGIPQLEDVLQGRYQSETGAGRGIVGARQLMDQFQIESLPGRGTTVVLAKQLPRQVAALNSQQITNIVNELVQRSPQNPYEEVQQQNQELLQALAELRKREEQLTQLNRELEDTNRGVVALYTELDEKADSLKRANELKTRFLSNMSHEFRTPLNSIMSLTRLLMDRTDGDLTSEQEKQVTFIRKSAAGLSDLVNDLLDLAKVEAGKTAVHLSTFEVDELFATLRGMLRPLLEHNSSVSLIFEEPIDIPAIHSDEGKVAQILRNFISNALKYTEHGEVRVSAVRAGDHVVLSVADTGIGISPQDLERIFEDFIQIESHLQKRVKGTGLGLPLSRKLAELLGGDVAVTSTPGNGSTFSATIPLVYPHLPEGVPVAQPDWQFDPQRSPVLVVEDHAETLFTYEKYLEGSTYQLIPARTLEHASQVLAQVQPVAIVLDILLEGENTWSLLTQLKQDPATRSIPVLVMSVVDNERQTRNLGADAFLVKPVDRLSLLKQLNMLINQNQQQKLLLIDDDLVARYLLKQQLSQLLPHIPLSILEASNGYEGIRLAQSEQPQAIILDLVMPEMSGIEVLDQLKQQPATSSIPVIINTSQLLEGEESQILAERTVAILSKENSSAEVAIAKLQEALIKAGLVLEAGGIEHD